MDYTDRHPDKPYLSSYDLLGKSELHVLITGVRNEILKEDKSKNPKPKPILELHGMKPMVMNITNEKMLIKLTRTSVQELWTGVIITLGVDPVKAFGEETYGLRIRRRLGTPEQLFRSAESPEKLKAMYVAVADVNHLELVKQINNELWKTK
jgi:hypothetical protein